ncbi:MAG: glycosyl transferase [Halobacteriovoraceae bacterium]|nr:glycosyl transferase [Halobacteriovoraceae bacterium]
MLISIVTPCYNCADFIYETYQTVKNQTFSDWEWLCVDDCSTDDTNLILQELASGDERVKVFKNEKNSGAAVTRNRGLEEASGNYIAFLDADDIWDPAKLALQLDFMQIQALHFSYHNYQLVNSDGIRIKEMIIDDCYVAGDLLKYNPFATSSIMISKFVADRTRFREHLRRRQDYIFWYEALKLSNRGQGMSEFLSSYRQTGEDSLSADKKKMALIQWQLLNSEFKLNLFERVYYFLKYAIWGLKKYFL